LWPIIQQFQSNVNIQLRNPSEIHDFESGKAGMLSGGVFVHKMWFFCKAKGKFIAVFVDRILTKEKR
jgi:hypothetical protein